MNIETEKCGECHYCSTEFNELGIAKHRCGILDVSCDPSSKRCGFWESRKEVFHEMEVYAVPKRKRNQKGGK